MAGSQAFLRRRTNRERPPVTPKAIVPGSGIRTVAYNGVFTELMSSGAGPKIVAPTGPLEVGVIVPSELSPKNDSPTTDARAVGELRTADAADHVDPKFADQPTIMTLEAVEKGTVAAALGLSGSTRPATALFSASKPVSDHVSKAVIVVGAEVAD